jgi:hypothetical protein
MGVGDIFCQKMRWRLRTEQNFAAILTVFAAILTLSAQPSRCFAA